MGRLTLQLFGGLRAYREGGADGACAGRKAQALLAYLALNPKQRCTRDRLATLLWSDRGEEQARQSLRQAVRSLHKALGDESAAILVSDGERLTLVPEAVAVDVHAFERLSATNTREALEQATALYTGDFLEGIDVRSEGFEEWLAAERARLRDLAADALQRLTQMYVDSGEWDSALRGAQQLLALDPLREEAHRILMRLYDRTERRALALRQYRVCEETLKRELDTPPAPETVRLHSEIRACNGEVAGDAAEGKATAGEAPRLQGRETGVPQRVDRKLAAILAADIAGYGRLIGADEEGTIARLKALRRELIDPKIEEHRGRIVKTTGDGILIEFPSVVEAVRCAVEVQRGMVDRNADLQPDRRIEFRVGVNLGDIVVDGKDIHGDGVNIAARLEALAEPGGICLSRAVRDHIRDKLPLNFEDMGEREVKNIARPLRVFRVSWDGPGATGGRAGAEPAMLALSLPDKPSIAVLPFQNLSGDPEQDYFADGMVEDIITALSRMRWVFVIARNSSFTYKGRTVDVKQVARELGVRYVLEGSVRKAASRVRIAGQLIDGSTGAHLWADRFEGALEDIFDLQDQVTASVVGAIAPRLEQAEIERAKRKPTENLDAYDCYLRGRASLNQWTKEGTSEALRMFYRAIELDPDYASAHGMAAWCYCLRKVSNWMTDREQEIAETARLARRAVALGKDDAAALSAGGIALAYVVGDLDDGAAFIDQALALNPNLAAAWYYSGWARIWLGEPDTAIEHIARAMRLSPLEPLIGRMQGATAHAHFFAGRYDMASSWAGMALRAWPDYPHALRMAVASNVFAGRLEQAQNVLARLRQVDPALRVSNLRDTLGPYRRPEDLARYEEGLRRAGLPE